MHMHALAVRKVPTQARDCKQVRSGAFLVWGFIRMGALAFSHLEAPGFNIPSVVNVIPRQNHDPPHPQNG